MSVKLLVFIAAVLLCASAVCAQSDRTLINTKYGPLQGFVSGNFRKWLGVPFAKPPVGNLRWQSPQPPATFTAPFSATSNSKICLQAGTNGVQTANSGEDCLYLDVYVPINHTLNDAPLPVLIWLHGGSYLLLSSAAFPGDYLAQNNFIYVATNYRLGALGYLAHEALLDDTQRADGTGFYGMQDQRAAFKWVRDNIAAFGGNPNRVTVSGESAGAMSICNHLAAPRSAGLFQQVIMASAFCNISSPAEGLPRGHQISRSLGCDNAGSSAAIVSCLLAANASAVLAAQNALFYGSLPSQYAPARYYPTYFPSELADQPRNVIAAGKGIKVPTLIGNMLNESAYFDCTQGLAGINATTAANLITAEVGPANADKVLAAYPINSYVSPIAAFNDFQTDFVFRCQSLDLAAEFAAAGVPVYVFSIEYTEAFVLRLFGPLATCLNNGHGFDLEYFFNTYGPMTQATPAEAELSRNIRAYWTSFVQTGVPVLPQGLGAWPRYDGNVKAYVSVALNFTVKTGNRAGKCDVVSQVYNAPYYANQPTQAPATCKVDVTVVKRGNSWQENGQTFQVYDLNIKSVGPQAVTAVQVALWPAPVMTQSWNIQRQGSSNVYAPSIWSPLRAGDSYNGQHGFIAAGDDIIIAAVASVTCSN